MPFSSYYLIIYTILFISCFRVSTAGNNETDRLALLEIKAKINDPTGALNSWNDSLHFCTWYGVTCNMMHHRVTALDLHSSALSGFLSPHIGNLTYLTDLQLQNNSFLGTIPPEIGSLHKLQHLWIFNNSIQGEIPLNISGCYGLIQLRAGNNELVGSIPDSLGSLLNLQVLSLSINKLTGFIPSSLGNLSSLSFLALSYTKVFGSIPTSFGRLTKLTHLALGVNRLSGLIPPSIFNLSRLTELDLGENHFHGSLPSDLGFSLPLLTYFSISYNSFTGVIPTSVSNLSNLAFLQLDSNYLRGKVPSLKNMVNLTSLTLGNNSLGYGRNDDLNFVSSLGNASGLFTLDIHKNNFGGSFPTNICSFLSLEYLYLDINKISGEIPNCIGKLVNLQLFNIIENQISGVIPDSIGKLRNLNVLVLGYNHLSGFIPSSVGNLAKLTVLSLSGSNLVGQIPSSIIKCSNLLMIDLSWNNLSGSIPPEILSLSNLAKGLYLNNNRFTGQLHTDVGLLRNLLNLDVSRNMLSGVIPRSLSSCLGLEFLHMEHNFLEGSISDEFKTLMSLQGLYLSHNRLSGKIPEFLVNLPLKRLDLSYNNFKGEVPVRGVFGNETGISTFGNHMLCGGIPKLKLPKCTFDSRGGKIPAREWKLILVMIFVCLGMLVVIVVLLLLRYRNRQRKIVTDTVTDNSLLNLSYQSLLKATNGFSSGNLIGSGSFGIVYKGILKIEEPPVAIKVFKLEHRGASRSFMAECGVLRNIRHRNLVKVITTCSSTDYQGNEFKALVYEYMVNGSLDDWLHPIHENKSLTFRQRLDIAVDAAFAIEYLHHGCGSSIVHCDLKPSNILLDKDMIARVSDFGLAKFLSISQPLYSTTSLGLRGTVGYAPPEYGLGNEASKSGDVYSFGILLMEMVTGKRPTLEMFKNGLSLHKLVQEALPDQVTNILDGALLEDEYNKNSKSMMLEASISMFELALSCSAELPQERVDMKEVASTMSAIRNRLTGT